MVYINDFSEVGREDVLTAGGKGAGLGELVRAGLPVPPGFLVNTAAYELFIRDNLLAAPSRATLRCRRPPSPRTTSKPRRGSANSLPAAVCPKP